MKVDAHSELMTQYPWGFSRDRPQRERQRRDRGAFNGRRLVFRDTGRLPGETSDHSYTAIVGSDRDPVERYDRARPLRSVRQGRRCAADQTPAPMPSECDDGPFGRGTGGRLRYKVKVPAGGSTTVWIAVAGSDNSVAEARSEFRRADRRPRGPARREEALAPRPRALVEAQPAG